LIVVAIILIIAAIAIPSPLQSKMAADEGEAWARFALHLKAEIDSEPIENIAPVPLRFDPARTAHSSQNYFFFESAMAGLLTCLSNSPAPRVSKASPGDRNRLVAKRRGKLTEGIPGFRIHRRIDDRQRELQDVVAHAVEPLFHSQVAAMRTADIIDPGSCIEPNRLDDERGIVLPLAIE